MASDVVLTKVVYAYPFVWDHFVTWAWYAAVLWLGTRLRTNAKPLPVIGAALASSVSFFVISNFAVWAAYDMYPKNFGGLMTSYTLALPFFRHGVEGDLLFTSVFFATPVVLAALSEAFGRRPRGCGVATTDHVGQPPRLSSRASSTGFFPDGSAELRSAGQPRPAVPTWFVIIPARAGRSRLHFSFL